MKASRHFTSNLYCCHLKIEALRVSGMDIQDIRNTKIKMGKGKLHFTLLKFSIFDNEQYRCNRLKNTLDVLQIICLEYNEATLSLNWSISNPYVVAQGSLVEWTVNNVHQNVYSYECSILNDCVIFYRKIKWNWQMICVKWRSYLLLHNKTILVTTMTLVEHFLGSVYIPRCKSSHESNK